MTKPLASIKFASRIAYGYKDEVQRMLFRPLRGVFKIPDHRSGAFFGAFQSLFSPDNFDRRRPERSLWLKMESLWRPASLKRANKVRLIDFSFFPDSTLLSSIKDLNLNWDLRATEEWWRSKIVSPPGYSALAGAYMWGSLKFFVGNYSAMIRNPSMAGPFVKSFSLFELPEEPSQAA